VHPASLAAIAVIVLATAYGFVRKAPLSLMFAVAILAVYALQVATSSFGFVLSSPVVFDLGLYAARGSPPAPWTWITFEFVHASETHIFLNLLGLILISPTLEERIGSRRWAIVYFVGGAVGALVFLLVHLGVTVLLVGASAGIFAAFGAYGRLYPRDRIALFLPIPGVPSFPVIEVVVIFLALEGLLGFLGPLGIAWEAHVGALVFGFATAPFFMRIPLRGGRGRLVPVQALEDLATSPELQRMFHEAERADLPETRDAWIESFVRAARCPRCAGPLRRRFGRITSDCGWRRRL
jgi:membrane associated rhomboid family serine protease